MSGTVVAACPIRNRVWAVVGHVDGLLSQVRPPDALLYVTGDNDDETEEILRAKLYPHRRQAAVDRFDTGCPGWRRDGEPRYSINDHEALARVYNRCLDLALEQWPEATHVWMLDSDVTPDPNVLELLLAADKDLVSAVVPLSERAWNFMLGRNWKQGRGPYRNGTEWAALSLKEPIPVTFLAACTLIRREVLEAWVRFAPHPRSHDFPFCSAAEEAGFGLWVEPRARCAHWRDGPEEEPLR